MHGFHKLTLFIIVILVFSLPVLAQDTFNIQKTGEIFNFWSSIADIEIVDTTAVLSTDAGLFFLSISNPSEPTFISRCDDFYIGKIKVHDNFIYSYSNFDTLTIYDMSDVTNPVLSCEYTADNNIKYLDFYNDLVILLLADNTLSVVDFSNLSSPEIVGTYSFFGDAGEFSIDGTFLYIPVVTVDEGPNIRVLDISNTAEIYLYANIPFRDLECDLSDGDVITFDDIAYVFWATRLFIYDISDPSPPSFVSTTLLPESHNRFISQEDSCLFLSGGDLSIYDISTPSEPVLHTTYTIPDSLEDIFPVNYTLVPTELSAENSVLGMVVSDDYYEFTLNRFVSFFDISDLSNITPSYYYDYWEWITEAKINDNLLYTMGIKQRIFDISSMENYVELGSIDKRFSTFEMNSDYLFGYSDSLYFYDISDSSSPQLVNSLGITMSHPELSASDEYLVVTQSGYENSRVLVYDVTNPADISGQLMQQGYPEWGVQANDAAIIGNYIYVVGSFGDYDLQVYEIFGTGDSRYLAIRSEMTISEATNEWYSHISIEDGLLLLNGGSCYIIMDIEDRLNPSIIYKNTETTVYDIVYSDNHLFMTVSNGMEIVDITNPERAWVSGYYHVEDHQFPTHLTLDDRGILVPYYTRINVYDYTGAMGVDGFNPTSAPTEYEQVKAYPNPFNPTLNIKVSLPETGALKLTIHNVLGQQVAVLSDRTLERGYHNFTFDGSELSSGVYFVKAVVEGKMNDVQKVMLMK